MRNILKIKLLVLFLLSLIISCSAQQSTVLQYLQYLENLPSTSLVQYLDGLEKEKLQKAAKLMYEADETNAIQTKLLLAKRDKEIDSINNTIGSNALMPDKGKWGLFRKFKTEFPNDIFALVHSAYLIKVSIRSVHKYIYEDSTIKLPRTDIQAQVLEIIKGKSKFNMGDEFTFYYMNYWIPQNEDFQEGGIYFVCLIPQWSAQHKLDLIALDTSIGENNYGFFQIEKGYLLDNNNYWGYGNEINWKDFKTAILHKINTIKSW